jgi:hypothetical protein
MRVWEPGGATVGNEDWAVWRGLDGLWRYGVGHWCTLKAPDGGKRPARWPMAENWRHIVAGPRWGPVVNVLGAQFVTIGRQRRRPLKSSKVGEGEAKRSALQLDLAGVTTGDGTINVIESEPGVVAWGDGIASEDKAKKLRAAADQAGIELDVISAEARRDRLLPQIIGTIATYAGAHAVAVRNQGEPMDLLDACFLVAERAELDPEIHAAFREKQRLARHRAAFTGAIRVRRSMAQDYGKKKPKKAEQEFNEKRDRWEYPRKKG